MSAHFRAESAASLPVPLAQIERLRLEFPDCTLRFELQLGCKGAASLSELCRLFDATGLELIALKYGQNGNVFCVLQDRDGGHTSRSDLAGFAQLSGKIVSFESWTTQIIYKDR